MNMQQLLNFFAVVVLFSVAGLIYVQNAALTDESIANMQFTLAKLESALARLEALNGGNSGNGNGNNNGHSGGEKSGASGLAILDKQLKLRNTAHQIQAKKQADYRTEVYNTPKGTHLAAALSYLGEHHVLWWFYENTYQCAVDQRYGTSGDGGKWICNPDFFNSPCVVYSFGVRDDFSFEVEIHEKTQCETVLFDPTINTEAVKKQLSNYPGMSIHKLGLVADESGDYKRLSTIMENLHHTKIDILKIDIEGHEKAAFKEFLNTHKEAAMKKYGAEYPPIATLILVEIHYGTKDINWHPDTDKTNMRSWDDWFSHLEEEGYVIYHKEMNLYDGSAAEYCFVHKRTMEKMERDYYSQ